MVITTILGVSFHNTYASGIPVVDGALNGLMKFETIKAQEHRLATIAQWAKDVTHYASVIQNWKDNFKNQIRNQLMEMLGINLKAGTINKEEVLNLLEKKKMDCNRIANMVSSAYCKEMIVLEQEKITVLFNQITEIEELWIKYQDAVNKYNIEQRKQSLNGEKNAGSVQGASDNIQNTLLTINNKMAAYEKQAKIFDQRIETLRKARVQIAQEQMKGTNLVTAVAKSAVALNLKSETSKYEDKIIQQRNNVSSRSQEAFSGRTTNINTQYQEF